MRILFLAPDPSDAARLRLGKELKDIRDRLDKDKFQLEERWAVRPKDILQTILDTKPQIVHFSGHGMETGELCFEDEQGNTQPVQPEALAALFQLVTEDVKCVVINTCYSEEQAKAIAEHIPFVIGMKEAIVDKAAIVFATGFYAALAVGQTIEQAFKFGRVAIQLDGFVEAHSKPVLIFGDPRNRFREEVEQVWSQLQKIDTISAKIYKKAFQEKGKRMELPTQEAESIIDEVFKQIKEFKQKSKKYEQEFRNAIREELPLSEETRKALQYLQNELGLKDEDVALVENEIATASGWETPEAFFDRGFNHRRLGEYQKAIDYFTKAIDLKQTYSGAYLERGITYYNIGNESKAIEDYTQAIEINSNWDFGSLSIAHFERGLAFFRYAKKENYSENMRAAIVEWTETLRLKTNYSVAYYNRALAYSALDEREKAIEDYTQAININNDWGAITPADAYYNRGLIYQALGDSQVARQDFQKAWEILQKNANYINLFPEIQLEYLKSLFTEATESTAA